MAIGVVTELSDDLARLHHVGVTLAVVTGMIHPVLSVGVLAANPTDPLGIAFVGAAGGFAAGIVGVLCGDERHYSWVVLLGIPFTAEQAILCAALDWPSIFDTGGVANRPVQLAPLAALFVLYRRDA